MNDTSSRHLIIVIGLATTTLIALSLLPLSDITGNRLKDFDLFEDLFPTEYRELNTITPVSDSDCNFDKVEMAEDVSTSATVPAKPQITYAPAQVANAGEIENYTSGVPLSKFKAALMHVSDRVVRVAFLGDSFIEGDILTQDFRDLLQKEYGGSGVGFMAMHSDFPGFRHTVRQTDAGWSMHDIRTQRSSDTIRTISGDYATVNSVPATTTYKGCDWSERTKQWSRSTVMFLAPRGGTVSLLTDDGVYDYTLEAKQSVQALTCLGLTSKFGVKVLTSDIIALGAFLDGDAGIQVDCMSVRGNTGVGHRNVNSALTEQMRREADYSLIVMEYGVNALSAAQTDYSAYSQSISLSIEHLKSIYPEADIILMGIADRGYKEGSAVRSLRTCEAMVKAQRDAAKRSNVHFWDTRTAMGGNDACAEWRRNKLMNADYTHINHKGGERMAKLLYDAIKNVVGD
ncbi:MAG: hypothetical protein K2F78_03980 [Muribaculaceae bacterium]|nr:hypothetical protein [Muribaculaceae bacterium]